MTDSKEEHSKERCVISATDAVINPRAMMVASLDAIVTQLAVA